MPLQVADGKRHADSVLREWLTGWSEYPCSFREAARRQRNIGSDADVVRADVLGDPVIRGVRARTHNHMMEQWIGARAQSAVAHEMHDKAVSRRHALHFAFHRAGIAVDIDFQHEAVMPRG